MDKLNKDYKSHLLEIMRDDTLKYFTLFAYLVLSKRSFKGRKAIERFISEKISLKTIEPITELAF